MAVLDFCTLNPCEGKSGQSRKQVSIRAVVISGYLNVLSGSLKGKERHNTRNFLKQISADNVVPTAPMPYSMDNNAVNSGLYSFSVYSTATIHGPESISTPGHWTTGPVHTCEAREIGCWLSRLIWW